MYDPQASINYDQSQGAGDEQYISTFFCRALYDYQTEDSSSLSFRKGDIIEVLTRLESGWWDGLLNDERGWFPSNYVTVISDQEAEAALNGSEFPGSQASLPDDSMVDMAHTMSQALSQTDQDGDWLNGDVDYDQPPQRGASYSNGAPSRGGGTQHHDFWVPQVSQDGRVRDRLTTPVEFFIDSRACRYSTSTRRQGSNPETYPRRQRAMRRQKLPRCLPRALLVQVRTLPPSVSHRATAARKTGPGSGFPSGRGHQNLGSDGSPTMACRTTTRTSWTGRSPGPCRSQALPLRTATTAFPASWPRKVLPPRPRPPFLAMAARMVSLEMSRPPSAGCGRTLPSHEREIAVTAVLTVSVSTRTTLMCTRPDATRWSPHPVVRGLQTVQGVPTSRPVLLPRDQTARTVRTQLYSSSQQQRRPRKLSKNH